MPPVLLRAFALIGVPLTLFVVAGCSPQVGSEAWCKAIADRPASEWSFKDTAEYAKSCVLALPGKVGSDAWCKELKSKSPADWSANDAKNFAQQCILR